MKKIAVVTATRAEYGLLKPLIEAIQNAHALQLQLLVTGMHLMPEFGNTYLQIEKDGFHIDEKVHDHLEGDSAIEITESLGNAVKGFGQAIQKLGPDIIVLLGDRSEIMAAALSATIHAVPIAHIHGGETTEGAYDEFIRHAITKMSHLHFASCMAYKNRIIQMGEAPERVFNVGAIGVDSIMKIKLLGKENFEGFLKRRLAQKSCIITFHPVTLENFTAEEQFDQLLSSLDELEDTTLIFTKPNSDKGGRILIEMIDSYVAQNNEKSISFTSMGQLNYLSGLQFVDFVIGNSSSGILEVPYFNKPTINIGDRQKGRLAPRSVIHCEPTKESITQAINMACSSNFKNEIVHQEQLYGDGTATKKIVDIIGSFSYLNLQKPFFDLNATYFEEF